MRYYLCKDEDGEFLVRHRYRPYVKGEMIEEISEKDVDLLIVMKDLCLFESHPSDGFIQVEWNGP